MSLIKKLGILCALTFGLVNPSYSKQTDYRTAFKNQTEITQELNEFKLRQDFKRQFRIGYEEWKRAVESPELTDAQELREKARRMSKYPLVPRLFMEDDEIKEFEEFWKSFIIDIPGLKIDEKSKEEQELLVNYGVPTILEMQLDIDRTYNPVDIRNPSFAFNYSKLNEGQKILIFWHFKHEARYYSEGGKRKDLIKIK